MTFKDREYIHNPIQPGAHIELSESGGFLIQYVGKIQTLQFLLKDKIVLNTPSHEQC